MHRVGNIFHRPFGTEIHLRIVPDTPCLANFQLSLRDEKVSGAGIGKWTSGRIDDLRAVRGGGGAVAGVRREFVPEGQPDISQPQRGWLGGLTGPS